jgi:hypothetical protein
VVVFDDENSFGKSYSTVPLRLFPFVQKKKKKIKARLGLK